MTFEYRVIPLPAVWPGRSTPDWERRRSPFKSVPGKALRLLAREIGMLNGTNVRIAIDVAPDRIRQDGMLYANARARTPAVIVLFDTPRATLQFPCDTFTFWESNVDAVARALEALRLVDRYGVQQGAQYTGFKALPASTAPTMTAEAAAVILASPTFAARDILADPLRARDAWRMARARTHPDAGGTLDAWHQIETARAILEAHFGRPL